MRGTLVDTGATIAWNGIIPAHAGNTLRVGVVNAHLGDHPRACGEHCPVAAYYPRSRGSSPRMRGTLRSTWLGARPCGIIPAHAGNTLAM